MRHRGWGGEKGALSLVAACRHHPSTCLSFFGTVRVLYSAMFTGLCVCRERVAQHLDQPPVHPPPTAFHVSLVFSFSVVESLPYRVLCVGTVTPQSTGVFCNYVGEKTQELREKHGQSADGAPPQEQSQPQQSSPLPSSGARSSCQFSSSPFLFRLEESSQGHDVALSCTSMYGPDNTYAQHTRRRRGSEGSPREGGGRHQTATRKPIM